ncbi:hypothetical protein BH10PSE12_BH10PSE12_07380 [soil metagenome]
MTKEWFLALREVVQEQVDATPVDQLPQRFVLVERFTGAPKADFIEAGRELGHCTAIAGRAVSLEIGVPDGQTGDVEVAMPFELFRRHVMTPSGPVLSEALETCFAQGQGYLRGNISESGIDWSLVHDTIRARTSMGQWKI